MRCAAAVAVAAALGALLPPSAVPSPGNRIAVILSAEDSPSQEALSGFQKLLRERGVAVEYDVHLLPESRSAAQATVRRARTSGTKLMVSFGSPAASLLRDESIDIPVVACMLVRPDVLRGAHHMTGVSMEFSPAVQFDWLQRMMPHARTIGVLYNPSENKQRVESAILAAEQKGLKLEAQAVRNPGDVPAALDYLAKRVDVMWGIPDTVALSPQLARHVLLFSFRNSIPFIGLSPTWVKAGAFFSLDWDYADLGAQAGEMAAQILSGVPANSIPPASPRNARYALNLRTARQMKIALAPELVRGAQTLYHEETD